MTAVADVEAMMNAMEVYIHSINVRRDTDRFGGEIITDDQLIAARADLLAKLVTVFGAV